MVRPQLLVARPGARLDLPRHMCILALDIRPLITTERENMILLAIIYVAVCCAIYLRNSRHLSTGSDKNPGSWSA